MHKGRFCVPSSGLQTSSCIPTRLRPWLCSQRCSPIRAKALENIDESSEDKKRYLLFIIDPGNTKTV